MTKMGLMDMFKKKDDFDDFLKEPEGGSWDKPGNPVGDVAGLPDQGTDFGANNNQSANHSSDFNDIPPLGSDPTGLGKMGEAPLPNSSMPGDFSSPSSESVVPGGLPSDSWMGSKREEDGDSLSSNSTSASPLNMGGSFSQNSQSNNTRSNNYESMTSDSKNETHLNNANSGMPKDNMSRDIELIMTKLDLIKSTLQNLDARMSKIESKLYEARW
ncbi:hypothetical protein BVX95_01745 [archaeon D22]|nr:hypothetical protein BVX95_01745 [archaeon D22]